MNGINCRTDGSTRSQIEGQRHGRELSLMIHFNRSDISVDFNQGSERYLLASRRGHIDVIESVGAVLKARADLKHHTILGQAGIDRRNKALSKGFVERSVDGRIRYPVTPRHFAIDGDIEQTTRILLVPGDVGE